MTIKLVNQYSVERARNWIRGSLQAHGEQCILLSMYRATDTDARQCPNCADDVYVRGSNRCPICYGTGFVGGAKSIRRVWALFSDTKSPEKYSQRGVWSADSREVQTEPFPELVEHDYLVRVRVWDLTNTIPQELEGYYGIGEVDRDSMRTGARFGQFRWDVVGQRAPVTKLQTNVGICSYPILGQAFPDITWTGTQPNVPSVIQPDQKVVYVPQNTHFTQVLGDGTETSFAVIHKLGTTAVNVSVYRVSTGELVDPDVFLTDPDTVTVRFRDVPTVGEYNCVVTT